MFLTVSKSMVHPPFSFGSSFSVWSPAPPDIPVSSGVRLRLPLRRKELPDALFDGLHDMAVDHFNALLKKATEIFPEDL